MKAVRENRRINLSDLPEKVNGLTIPREFSICVNYTTDESPERVGKAIAIDHLIIPLIVSALNGEKFILPGTAGTVSRGTLNTTAMGDGEGKPTRVIDAGKVKLYVGIGWIDERDATQADADSFPVVVE